MPSASSPVRAALESYVAGRLKAERLVIAVATAYYGRESAGDGGRGTGEALRPLIDVIDRASPGVVELGSVESRPGFEVRLVERPFPPDYEVELRRAAEEYLGREGASQTYAVGTQQAAPLPTRGLITRLVRAVRRLFTASA